MHTVESKELERFGFGGRTGVGAFRNDTHDTLRRPSSGATPRLAHE